MRVLGIETSCDETGVALFDSEQGLLGHALHSQVALHAPYGGVVPELASRDHVRRTLPLVRAVLEQAGAAPARVAGGASTVAGDGPHSAATARGPSRAADRPSGPPAGTPPGA